MLSSSSYAFNSTCNLGQVPSTRSLNFPIFIRLWIRPVAFFFSFHFPFLSPSPMTMNVYSFIHNHSKLETNTLQLMNRETVWYCHTNGTPLSNTRNDRGDTIGEAQCIRLNERSQTQKTTYCMISFIRHSGKCKSIDDRSWWATSPLSSSRDYKGLGKME